VINNENILTIILCKLLQINCDYIWNIVLIIYRKEVQNSVFDKLNKKKSRRMSITVSIPIILVLFGIVMVYI